MSERDGTARAWIAILVIVAILLICSASRDVSEIRDLQRRVGQLEESERR